MTLDREPCHLVPISLNTLHSEPCHTGGVFMVVKVEEKRLAKSNPNDSLSETLSVGPNVINAIVAQGSAALIFYLPQPERFATTTPALSITD